MPVISLSATHPPHLALSEVGEKNSFCMQDTERFVSSVLHLITGAAVII